MLNAIALVTLWLRRLVWCSGRDRAEVQVANNIYRKALVDHLQDCRHDQCRQRNGSPFPEPTAWKAGGMKHRPRRRNTEARTSASGQNQQN